MGMSERPGVMFYFSDWSGILNLGDDATLGRFARAALEYGQSGTDTTFQGIERAIWEPLKARIDRDGERYQRRREAGGYAVYCREEKREGRTPLAHAEWNRHQSLSNDSDSIHTQTQSHTHTQSQPQTVGNTTVHATVSDEECASSLNEQDFERKRETALNCLKRGRDDEQQQKRGRR